MNSFRIGLVVLATAAIGSGCSCNNVPPSFDGGGGGVGGGSAGGAGGGSAGGVGGGSGGGIAGGAGGGSAGGVGGGGGSGGGSGGGNPDGGCFDLDGDGYGTGPCLGLDCDDTNPAIHDNATVSCFTFDAGLLFPGSQCKAGLATCLGGVIGSCINQVGPSTEQCNGLDDDCNQKVDDGISGHSCYSGPAGTLDAGICRGGIQDCSDAGFGSCVGEVLPAPAEVCGNGKDDNCNGQTDEAPCAADTYVCAGCANANDTTNSGTQQSPLKTIAKGIANAVSLGKPIVFVAGIVDGTASSYSEDLTIPDKVTVQGRWSINTSMGGTNNTWSRPTNGARTQLINTVATGLKFAPGGTRAAGLDGVSVQNAGAVGGATRAIGISILNAGPLLKDFAVLPSGPAAGIATENVGVVITGSAGAPAFPRLEGLSLAAPSTITVGDSTTGTTGIFVTNARVQVDFVNVSAGGAGAGVSAGVQLIDSPQSELKDATINAGRGALCLGVFSQGASGGTLIDTVTANGCPGTAGGATLAPATGVGIVFDNCSVGPGLAKAQVKNSTASGGTTNGAKSISIAAAAVDGCDVSFSNNTFNGGQASGANVPETEIGVVCSFQGLKNPTGADSPCTLFQNTISPGSANSASAVGIACSGSCGTKTSACTGSCGEVQQNTITATTGQNIAAVSIVDGSPFFARNKIGFNANGISGCNANSLVALSLDGSGSTVVNNFIAGGPCQLSIGVLQTIDVRTGDGSVVAPTVQFNTIVASGNGTSPLGANSIGAQLGSTAAIPATTAGKGTWRNNIITAGPVFGPNSNEVVFREADAKSDPQIFWNNLLHATTGSSLYINEGATPLSTAAAINALTDISVQGNLAGNPFYVAPNQSNYHLQGISPARGAGNATGAPLIDFDGEARPNPTGSNPDIGADEVP